MLEPGTTPVTAPMEPMEYSGEVEEKSEGHYLNLAKFVIIIDIKLVSKELIGNFHKIA